MREPSGSMPKGAKAQGTHTAHLRPFGIPEGIYIQSTHNNRKRAYIVNQYTFRTTKQRPLSCGRKFYRYTTDNLYRGFKNEVQHIPAPAGAGGGPI